ncbi:MAG: glycosyltransferase family 4 protein, partial [Deltaproteobacteria bacterium]|nr:glycosyltransferase family 4 protein [Deltaproteobacteria bacterium]
MKIAVVIPKFGLVGGAEGFAAQLTAQLAGQKDFEIHVFAHQWRRGDAPLIFHKVPVIRFPRFLKPFSFAYFAQRMIKSGAYHLVHSHDRIFQMDLLTMHGVPHKTWVEEARGKPSSLFDRSMAWVERKGIAGPPIPMILPVSNLVKDELLRCYDIPEHKIQVIHPGISPDHFSALDRECCRNEIRQRHHLASDDVLVLFVGMNFEIKRLDLVVKGVADLAKRGAGNANVKLVVVGKGRAEPYLTLARHLGIADRLIFAGVSHEIEKYYLASDIFAMPSRYDTFGMAVLEAMMAGLPVIITQKVGARDLVDCGIHGFTLKETPSPLEISEKLTLLMEKNSRITMGNNAQSRALEHTWEKKALQVAALYRSLPHDGDQNRHLPSKAYGSIGTWPDGTFRLS